MKQSKILDILITFLVSFSFVFYFFNKTVSALELPYEISEDVPERCDEDGYIYGTYCPCPPSPGLASVCGFVNSSNIVSELSDVDVLRRFARPPIGGVTVTIYEKSPEVSSGQPFGKFERKFTECVTTAVDGVNGEEGGVYHCLMRRINPSNSVYVVFSCGGKVADIKELSSVKSFFPLNSDVDCRGSFEYTPLPGELEYTNRSEFLGCQSSYEDLENPNAGFEKDDYRYTYESTYVEEKGHDTRFSGLEVLADLGFLGEYDISGLFGINNGNLGAWWENDCILRYGLSGDYNRDFFYEAPYTDTSNGIEHYALMMKCNLDVERDGDGLMVDSDELTTPFRYDIPTHELETEQIRVWETRTSMQREIQDPKAFAQYNHLMFGECIGRYFLRNYGDATEDQPIPCREILKCIQAVGNPVKNTHTTHSFATRLANPVLWKALDFVKERDQSDVLCHDEERDIDVTLADVQPLDSDCVVGEPGCPYLLPNDYWVPQFFILAGGVKKTQKAETINDAYGSASRSLIFTPGETEAELAHKSGHYVNFEDVSSQKTNSGVSSTQIATRDVEEVTNGLSGRMVNSFVNPVDAREGLYRQQTQGILWDIGGDVKSLCTVNNVNNDMVIPNVETELAIEDLLSNFFVGNLNSQALMGSGLWGQLVGGTLIGDLLGVDDGAPDRAAASSTYATDWGKARDIALSRDNLPPGIIEEARDVYDSILRYSSGGGSLTFTYNWLEVGLQTLVGRGSNSSNIDKKSFANRGGLGWYDAGYPSYVRVNYCIAEDTFEEAFPAYGEPGYPGDAEGCYPWVDVPGGEYCDVWPGNPQRWDDMNGTVLARMGYQGGWPGIEGELRTCKADCGWYWYEWYCADIECHPIEDYPFPPGDVPPGTTEICGCGGDIRVRLASEPCDPEEEKLCLERQLDTTNKMPDPPHLKEPAWNISIDPNNPETTEKVKICDLSKAGPMQLPGDLEKDHSARIEQAPIGIESQIDVDPLAETSNFVANAFSSPIAEKTNKLKGSFVDYATTNDTEPIKDDQTTHRGTAGERTQGFGTGVTTDILQLVAYPYRNGSIRVQFPYHLVNQEDICDYRNPESWCYVLDVMPTPIDLDTIDGGSCNPNTDADTICPRLPGVAERILGAAGANSNVDGSLLIAVIAGEGDWFNLLDWSDRNVRSWSEPWYQRMPICNDMQVSAQGPFGLITRWFEAAVRQGGYHPNRLGEVSIVNDSGDVTFSQMFPSKCNFLDAAYATAKLLSPGNGLGCDGELTRAEAAQALAVYRMGSEHADPSSVPERLINIAMNCR